MTTYATTLDEALAHPDEVTELVLARAMGEALDELPAEIGRLRALRRLVIPNCEGYPCHLPPAFAQLVALEELEIDGAPYEAIPPEILRLERLRSLALRGTRIHNVTDELSHLRALESLDLAGSELTACPPLWQLRALRRVNLSRCGIAELPLEIAELPLDGLRIAGTRLATLPPAVALLAASLVELDLGGIPVVTLPAFRRLEVLALAYTQLTTFPEALPLALRVLSLEGNTVEIPPSIGRLVGLQQLCLTRMGLTRLPVEMGSLVMLEMLDVSSNHLETLPASLGALPVLDHVDLSDNPIGERPTFLAPHVTVYMG